MNWKIKKLDNWNLLLQAPSYERVNFKYKSNVPEYNYYLGRYVYVSVDDYLFKEEVAGGFIFGIGFSSYLLYNFMAYFDKDSIDLLTEYNPVSPEITDLRDYQLSDLYNLLKFTRGIFQVYTGYGKTQIIASLINYIRSTDKVLLVLTPSSSSINTLKDRIYKNYNISTPYFDYNSNLNIINVNGFPRSNYFDESSDYWSKIDIIIADEVEHTCNDTAMYLLNLCKNVSRCYGFSATADNKSAERIQVMDGNIPVIQRNKWLINYFGVATVFKLPTQFNITLINIKTTLFNNIAQNLDSASEYTEIIYDLFTDDKFCRGLLSIIKKEKGIFIPMFRLQVIDYWIENYLKEPDLVCINLCSRGYELYISGEFKYCLSIDDVNELIDNNIVDVIVGTKTSFNSIDLPNLNKAMILHSKLAGVVIQAIGRVTRKNEFTLLNLIPYNKVAMYSKDLNERMKLIRNYYRNCNINEIDRLEGYYGII